MTRRRVFALLAAALLAPWVKTARPVLPRYCLVAESAPEWVLPGSSEGGWITEPARMLDVGQARPYPVDRYWNA